MLVIGLTGGIGSGKTTAANLFEKLGATIIDTDQLARKITQPGQPALQQIVERFGPSILLKDGTLNRSALRKIIFNDDEKRIWLEKLLHPLIRTEMQNQIEHATSPYCIVVIPLLLETEPNPLINRILVIDTPEKEQIKRVQFRDNATPDEINAIIKTQVSRIERIKAANDIIENEGSPADLMPKVQKLHQYYCALAQKNCN